MGIEEAIAAIKEQDLEMKIAVLNELWADIENKILDSEVPEEHKKILELRLNSIDAGEAKFTTWAETKKKILDERKY